GLGRLRIKKLAHAQPQQQRQCQRNIIKAAAPLYLHIKAQCRNDAVHQLNSCPVTWRKICSSVVSWLWIVSKRCVRIRSIKVWLSPRLSSGKVCLLRFDPPLRYSTTTSRLPYRSFNALGVSSISICPATIKATRSL